MLFAAALHDDLRAGRVTVAFRRWRRPTVRQGGTLQTPAGLLHIDELTAIAASDVDDVDARAAGFRSRRAALDTLPDAEGRTLYRIRFHRIGDDPRTALRTDDALDTDELGRIDAQLDRWDAASPTGAWTAQLLGLVARRPGEPSRALATEAGTEQARLKRRVRQLKGLGLTESLGTGYRISPRGRAYLDRTGRNPGGEI